jgi:predicted nucleic acid-binding protein
MQRLSDRRVYLDANIFILFVEAAFASGSALHQIFDGIGKLRWAVVTSDLSLAEVLVRPIQLRNEKMIAIYEAALQARPGLERSAIDVSILRSCARIRADHGLRLPDAIHVASALATNCQFLITEDKRLRSFDQLQVLRLADLVIAPTPPAETP